MTMRWLAITLLLLGITGAHSAFAQPAGSVSPASYDYGPIRVNDMAASPTKGQTFTVTNAMSASADLSVSAITFGGAHPGDFKVTSGPSFPATLTPGASEQWTVTFDPSDSGLRTTTMSVLSNDPMTPDRMVALQGTGTVAVIGLGGVAFGVVSAGTTASSTSTLSNTSTVDQGVLTATAATITPTTPGNTWFTFGAGLGCTAGTTACSLAGATAPTNKAIPVRCSPPAAASGTETATLEVTSDSDSGPTLPVTLSCTAGRPNISVDVTSVDLGDTVVGSSATTQNVLVTNTGNQPLTFHFARMTGQPGQFSASTATACGTSALNLCSVNPTMSMAITVGFTPTSTGPKTTTLVITNNDPDAGDSPTNVMLDGNGIAPVASPDPASINFGSVELGKTSGATTLTVKNTGSATLVISNAGLTSGATDFQVTSGPTGTQMTMIAPMASVTWDLTCAPSAQGARTGNFRVVSNATPANLDVALSCNGLRGVLVIAPTSHNFGPVREGDTVTQSFTLSNTGNTQVSMITPTLDPKLLGFSIVSPTFPIDLAGGASTPVVVKFLPANANEGCAVAVAGDCVMTFTGKWGTTPTTTLAQLLLLGDGLNATFDTSPAYPNALDFGDVRWDLTKTMPVSVINTGGSRIEIRGTSIAGGTAIAGEFSVVQCTRNSVVVPCPTMAAPYVSNTMGDTLVLNVQCNPADRVAMLDATLTVTSDLMTGVPTRNVPLKCSSKTAGIESDPANMLLDFGATDLDAPIVPVTKRVTLKNTGLAMLSLGAATKVGANLARFAIGATPAIDVAPNGTFEVDVTYTPLAEKPPNAPDVAQITFPLTGVHGGPTSMTINISGYGADRHIGVGAAPTFPDTFRNPGDQAPVMPVKITNTGYAPLDLTAVMLDNEPIWTLDNPAPVIIPAASSHEFMVRFAPMMSGKAPTGHLVIMNNDNEKVMVSVDLDGNGLDRNVAMGPRVINLGFTGIGIPIRLSELAPDELLVVENADEVNDFLISTIKVDSIMGAEGTFEIIDRKGNEPLDVTIAAGTTQTFDITFSPQEIGDFEATATLYIAPNPSPQAQVTLRGRGLYVDARGGGGCSTTSGRGSLWLAALVVALLLGNRRRRTTRRATAALSAALVMCVLGNARESSAQASRNLDLDVFDPTPATVGTTFQAQRPEVGSDGAWMATALLTYANTALLLDTSQNDDTAVKNRAMLMLGGAYAFGGRFEAGARLPLLLQSGDAAGDPLMRFGIAPASGAALGDLTLHAKGNIGYADALGGELAWGAGVAMTIPTATDDEFAGSELPIARALMLGSLTLGSRLTITLNAGGQLRQTTSFANITQRSGGVWASALSFRVLDKLWAGGEVFGEITPGGRRTMTGDEVVLNTIEGLAGVHYRSARTLDVGIAAGRGVTSGPGTPAFRGLVTLSFTPGAETLRPIHPPRAPEPPKDTDDDGILDKVDNCPSDAEDRDEFADEDGCPDPDNDKDGHLDAADKCPTQAEDRDRFEDDDGCPDRDNDKDEIADRQDKCPLVPEDKDEFEDGDGCPEADNDKDGIVDGVDKCPKESEVINGTTDDDGCPDKGNALVVLSPDRLELLESIPFSGTRIRSSANNILGQLGATLRAHPEIVRVRLSAHVQPTKNAAADQKLSEARAKAIKDWLVDRGIDALRLQTSGYGGQKPLVPANSKGAQEINDRVELIILERK
jgi:outer membrane protein OmpA-like peptidoglycan-associated protein